MTFRGSVQRLHSDWLREREKVNLLASHPVKALGLKRMAAGVIKFPPAPGSTPIYRLCEAKKTHQLNMLQFGKKIAADVTTQKKKKK